MSFEITSNADILTFTLTRPEVRNAVNYEVMDGLEQFLQELERKETVKWGVITSVGGKAFCSGGDLGEFHTLKSTEEAYPMLSRMTRLLYRIATSPVQIIALMDGAAVGGGCEIAAACDVRLMKSSAKAGFIQGTLAITTGWGGASLLYEKEGNQQEVLPFLMEANVHSAQSLAEWGWVSAVYEEDKIEALEHFVAKFERIEPSVLRAYKAVAIRKWEQTNLQERMLQEAKQCSILWAADAHHAAVDRFRTKRS